LVPTKQRKEAQKILDRYYSGALEEDTKSGLDEEEN
jgi:hypothetical protein